MPTGPYAGRLLNHVPVRHLLFALAEYDLREHERRAITNTINRMRNLA